MAKEDHSGFLSKVAKFVRNPTTNWADLDQLDRRETNPEGNYSRQALKEMMERRRRNDFVRKREFDMLRKARRRESLAGRDHAANPSFFQSSVPSKPDDRASTLKKIDEIEAQMSMQWWKTKSGNSSLPGSGGQAPQNSRAPREQPELTPAARAAHYAVTDPAPFPQPSSTAMAPTQPAPLVADFAMTDRVGLGGAPDADTLSVQVAELAHDPELEEAAIRFANGDDAGAEASLREALGPGGTRVNHEETWLALFDLYRAIGEQARFEAAALDFSKRFERSPPAWSSMPDSVAQLMPTAPVSRLPTRPAHWASPARIEMPTVAALNAALAAATPPWRLDWGALESIDEVAVAPLRQLFAFWGAQPVRLQFVHAERLDDLLQRATPQGDKTVPQEWWRLRMEMLRLMNQADEFELVALTYCVLYEVSPPSWEPPRCEYRALESADARASGHGAIVTESGWQALAAADGHPSVADSEGAPQARRLELAGQIMGDAGALLQDLDEKLADAETATIDCAKLIRVDFSAAGTLLNWTSARHGQGHDVKFEGVHRLVAAFFNVIGINEVAVVGTRTD